MLTASFFKCLGSSLTGSPWVSNAIAPPGSDHAPHLAQEEALCSVQLSEGDFQVVISRWCPLACGPCSPELSSSCSDMAMKVLPLTFTGGLWQWDAHKQTPHGVPPPASHRPCMNSQPLKQLAWPFPCRDLCGPEEGLSGCQGCGCQGSLERSDLCGIKSQCLSQALFLSKHREV